MYIACMKNQNLHAQLHTISIPFAQCLMRGTISQTLKWIISHRTLKIIGTFNVNAEQGYI